MQMIGGVSYGASPTDEGTVKKVRVSTLDTILTHAGAQLPAIATSSVFTG